MAVVSLSELLKHRYEYQQYFYHPDHLGSSSFISDASGEACQFLAYLPFGEQWVDQRSSSSYDAPYKFSGKELDAETGYNYFGARYYNSGLSVWLSVDPLSDQYRFITPYSYTINNPLTMKDPTGFGVKVSMIGNTIYISASLYLYPGSDGVTEQLIQDAISLQARGNADGSFSMNFAQQASDVELQGSDGLLSKAQNYTVIFLIDIHVVTKEEASDLLANPEMSASNNYFEVVNEICDDPGTLGGSALGGNTGYFKLGSLADDTKGDHQLSVGQRVIMEEIWHSAVGQNYANGTKGHNQWSSKTMSICGGSTPSTGKVNAVDLRALFLAGSISEEEIRSYRSITIGSKADNLVIPSEVICE